MEKMVYERPVMKAELFQANDHVAICHIKKDSYLKVKLQRWRDTIWSNWSSTGWLNQETGANGGAFGNVGGFDTELYFRGEATKYNDGYYWTTEGGKTGENNDGADQGRDGTYFLYSDSDDDSWSGMYKLYIDGGYTDYISPNGKLDGRDYRIAYVTVDTVDNSAMEGS